MQESIASQGVFSPPSAHNSAKIRILSGGFSQCYYPKCTLLLWVLKRVSFLGNCSLAEENGFHGQYHRLFQGPNIALKSSQLLAI